jgi:hypothetical protein
MKIKDIRQFRTFYKERIRELSGTNRDEHFMGTKSPMGNGGHTFGFFDIYHGDKDKLQTAGIGGFLEGFLDMARDAQAVYEFLQNAVDAGSTRFAMRWGEDPDGSGSYLLVVNNGRQFDFAAVRSILNVGVSTKDETQHTIGKFGIGFKLAHRLVGQSNGLNELLHQLYGPILFSWRNHELRGWATAGEGVLAEPTAQSFAVTEQETETRVAIAETHPWLFKILITNFPCQPGETIRDAWHRETNAAFEAAEMQRLGRWLAGHREQIPWEEYGEGSLFFIRLGPGKEKHLADERLEEGVKFSLAILNHTSPGRALGPGLSHVQLNGAEIERAPLQFESFQIARDTADYRYVRFDISPDDVDPLTQDQQQQMAHDADIELLLGYAADHEQATTLFENAPNFYLYFPLSEEQHRLRFVLHSNAFYKGSARTSLHIGTPDHYELNERLLAVFAQRLAERLAAWAATDASSDERQRFLAVYAALLLSEESTEANRTWINAPLVRPLHATLFATIPVLSSGKGANFAVVDAPDEVRLRQTQLPIEPAAWGLPYRWFYWSDHAVLRERAARQLQLKGFTVGDALRELPAVAQLNALLAAEPRWRKILLAEIEQELRQKPDTTKQPEVRAAVQGLQLFAFTRDTAYSWDELQHNTDLSDHLLAFDRIEPLRDLLGQVGFVLSVDVIDELYPNVLTLLRQATQNTYLSNFTKLNEHLSRRLVRNTFTKDEKLRVLKALAQADRSADQSNERAQALALFRNQGGHVVALKHLAKENFGESWLNPYCLHREEQDEAVTRYLVSERRDLLERVVVPLWDYLADDTYVRSVAKHFYGKVVELAGLAQQRFNLSDRRVVLLRGAFEQVPANLLYGPGLEKFTAPEYAELRQVLATHFGRVLPDAAALASLAQAPFHVSQSDYEELQLAAPVALTAEQARLLALFSHHGGFDLTQAHVWVAGDSADHLVLRPRSELTDERQVWVESPVMAAYLQRYHPACIIAPALAELRDTIELQGAELLRFVLDAWDGTEAAQAAALASLVLEQDDQAKLHYLARLRRLEWQVENKAQLLALHWAARVALGVGGDAEAAQTAWAQAVWLVPAEGPAFALQAATETSGDVLFYAHSGGGAAYELRLSQLFPATHGQQTAAVEAAVEALLQHQPGQLEESALWALFGRTEQPNSEAVLSRLQLHHAETGYLENGSQLALALLACQSGQLTGYPWRLQTPDGSVVDWRGTWAADGFPFFAAADCLAAIYMEAATLLRLTKTTPAFETPEARLYQWPVLRDGRFEGPRWQPDLSEAVHPSLLDELLDYIHKPQPVAAPQPWTDILGFEPAACVMPNQRLEPEEAAPKSWAQWRNAAPDEENRKRRNTVFAGLGLQLGFSAVCRLRVGLLNQGPLEVFDAGVIEQIPAFFLANTLKLLYERQIGAVYSLASPAGELVRRIVQALPADTDVDTVPWPVATAQSGDYRLVYFGREETEAYYYSSVEADEMARQQQPKLTEIVALTDVLVYDATAFGIRPSLLDRMELLYLMQEVDEKALEEQAEEWQDTFYVAWQQEFPDYSILRVAFVPLNWVLAERVVQQCPQLHEVFVYPQTAYVPRALATAEAIRQLGEYEGWEEAAEALAAGHESQRQHLADLLDQANLLGNPDLHRRVALLQKELEAEAERRKLKENLATSRYTFGWFRDFIELWALQSDDGDQTVPEKNISFARVEAVPESDRLLELCDPSRLITPTIEYCTGFRVLLHLTNGRPPQQVDVQGVSKKGQRVVAMLRNPNQLLVSGQRLDLAQEVQRVELRFSAAIDLINRLLESFRGLGRRQGWADDYDLNTHLPDRIRFLFGPPGTGKTTNLARGILARLEEQPATRLVALTPTNRAADELADKIIKENGGVAPAWLVRYGATFSPMVMAGECLYDRSSLALDNWPGLVLITTVHRYPYEEVNRRPAGQVGETIRLCDINWDGLWLDEASMLALPYAVFALHQRASLGRRPAEFVVGGDPQQIPPVLNIRDEDLPAEFDKEQNIYTMIGLSSFDQAEQRLQTPRYCDQVENLTTQYRSTQCIGELFSQFTYKGLLAHGRTKGLGGPPTARPLPSNFRRLLAAGHDAAGITLLRFPVNTEESLYQPGKLRLSPYHPYSALLVLEMVRRLADDLAAEAAHAGTAIDWTVGVVCPYRIQATLVNKMVESLDLPPGLTVLVDTVHGFQGGECDLILFLLSPTNENGQITSVATQFLHKHFLVNVAISRARDHLVILYPDQYTTGIANLYKFDQRSKGSIEQILRDSLKLQLADLTVQATAVEEALFGKGQGQYIQANYLAQSHEQVNIYGVALARYILKASTSAVDVQFRPG